MIGGLRSIAPAGILRRVFCSWSQSDGDGILICLKFNHRSTQTT